MLVDIRWHLLSLIAIFLALGLGMLIGTQIAHSGALEAEQMRLAERLEASLTALRGENRSLREELTSAQEALGHERAFSDLVLEALVAGTLEGMSVDVYVSPGHATAAERLLRLLAEAGAQARVSTGTPPGEMAGAATLVLWAGDGVMSSVAIPTGAVVAVPGAGQGLARLGQRADVIPAVETPLGLWALMERLRTGVAPKDAAAVLKERLGP